MKAILFILSMLSVLSLTAQKTEINYFLATLIIEECDAVIISQGEAEDGKSYDLNVELSSFYDFELFKMKIKSVCSEYSDVSTTVNWTLSDGGSYYKALKVGDENLIIMYVPDLRRGIFICQY